MIARGVMEAVVSSRTSEVSKPNNVEKAVWFLRAVHDQFDALADNSRQAERKALAILVRECRGRCGAAPVGHEFIDAQRLVHQARAGETEMLVVGRNNRPSLALVARIAQVADGGALPQATVDAIAVGIDTVGKH